MTALRAQDFPSLQARRNTNDDFAAIFEANLALTQLFSNAHDVLYATKDRSNQLNFGGEYVKYIDDFRTALRSWHSSFGSLTCSPPLKASLIFSYEYLRLYVNAFAYVYPFSKALHPGIPIAFYNYVSSYSTKALLTCYPIAQVPSHAESPCCTSEGCFQQQPAEQIINTSLRLRTRGNT